MATRRQRAAQDGPRIERGVPMAGLTTLGVGGPATALARCADEDALRAALAWARREGLPTFVLGGGSNVLAADAGFDGLVLQVDDQAITVEPADGGHRLMRIGAGADWGRVVAEAVAAGLGGVECLAGIPGRAGAAPIQNIGAYGQEIAETLVAVRALDRRTGEAVEIPAADCGFAYRWSRFKGEWKDRYLLTRVDLRLPETRRGAVRYGELARRLEREGGEATPARVREVVLELRRGKSMLAADALDPEDPNRHSAGSFFLNPVISAAEADRVEQRARARGVLRPLPRFDAPGGVKLPAAWLIEEAGFGRGYGDGPAGLSTRHCLAIVNRGGARAEDLVALAREVRDGVEEAFGVALEPEPVLLGFEGLAAG